MIIKFIYSKVPAVESISVDIETVLIAFVWGKVKSFVNNFMRIISLCAPILLRDRRLLEQRHVAVHYRCTRAHRIEQILRDIGCAWWEIREAKRARRYTLTIFTVTFAALRRIRHSRSTVTRACLSAWRAYGVVIEGIIRIARMWNTRSYRMWP